MSTLTQPLPFTVAALLSLTAPLSAQERQAATFPLWNPEIPLPPAGELPQLRKPSFHVIKAWDRKEDGYTFLHGVGLAWFRNQLFASFGHNRGSENTVTEEAHYRVSPDAGKSWGPLLTMDSGDEPDLAVSHGVFLSLPDALWAFHGAFYHKMEAIHTRAYRYDVATERWDPMGTVVEGGFWPMNPPVRLANGNWIMPGFIGGPYDGSKVFPAAVAISRGEDFTRWDLIAIPPADSIKRMWGESAILVTGSTIYNIARFGAAPIALVSVSTDEGRTWSPSEITNLPMAASKPAAGTLSSGHHYLVSNTAADNGNAREPLTIALSRPGEHRFSQIFVIRHARHETHPGESAMGLSLAYPYAVEHDGHLFIGYSNNGGRHGNLNSAELAVLSIAELTTGW